MTPKEKAKKLVDEFYKNMFDIKLSDTHIMETAKQCALITVNEIIKALRKGLPEIGLGKGYWYNVKQEIKKMI